jgi:hypothetical protein
MNNLIKLMCISGPGLPDWRNKRCEIPFDEDFLYKYNKMSEKEEKVAKVGLIAGIIGFLFGAFFMYLFLFMLSIKYM